MCDDISVHVQYEMHLYNQLLSLALAKMVHSSFQRSHLTLFSDKLCITNKSGQLRQCSAERTTYVYF